MGDCKLAWGVFDWGIRFCRLDDAVVWLVVFWFVLIGLVTVECCPETPSKGLCMFKESGCIEVEWFCHTPFCWTEFVLAYLRSYGFRNGVSLDERSFTFAEFKSLPLQQLLLMIYPDLYRYTSSWDLIKYEKCL